MTGINPNRRIALASIGSFLAVALSGCMSAGAVRNPGASREIGNPWSPDLLRMYAAIDDGEHFIPAVNLADLDPLFYRAEVEYDSVEAPGTVVVDTQSRYLYHVLPEGRAMRYGIGIGRAGFEWHGRAHVAYGREWPVWTPPQAMIARQPELERWGTGQPPGIDNALGARALYIHQGNRDTLYRIHGTTEANTIGRAVSSGCIRLLNQDIVHLYENVRWGSPLVVLI